jgi:hypothetical protein
MREEENVLGKTPHGRILLDKVMILQFGIQRVSFKSNQLAMQFSLTKHNKPN